MEIAGKQALILSVAILSLLATFGIITYTYEEAGIQYDAKLTSIGSGTNNIWGNIRLEVTNTRDSVVGFTDVNVTLINPITGESFYEYLNNGGSIESDSSATYNIPFDIVIDDIPDSEIIVEISGKLLWEDDITSVKKQITIPLTVVI